MHLDSNGFPVQADGVGDDTLQRVATLALRSMHWRLKMLELEVAPGVFVRQVGDNPNNVSGDQLMSVFAAAIKLKSLQPRLRWELIKRAGFSQNTRTMHSNKAKVPDFLLLRVLPFMCRYEGSWIPRWLGDLAAFVNVGTSLIPYKFADNSLLPHRKDDTETDSAIHAVNTLFAIMETKPTWIGKLTVRMYAKYRGPAPAQGQDNIEKALNYYHSPQFLGNPEVGEEQVILWRRAKEIAND
jgi:hypothetical protein